MSESANRLSLILAATQPMTVERVKDFTTRFGPDHRFLKQPDQWSAVVQGDQYDARSRYYVSLVWEGVTREVPALVVAVNKSGAPPPLFGKHGVIDQYEREIAVIVSKDQLPNASTMEALNELPEGVEPNLSGGSFICYMSSINLADPEGSFGSQEHRG